MLEAQFAQGQVFKRIVDSIKDLVTEANLDCTPTGINMQAMDSSHVSLVALQLKREGFSHFRVDNDISLGLNLNYLAKILKCAGNDDVITISMPPDSDDVSFKFENEAADAQAEFNMKLMDIDSENLGIPDTKYTCIVKMPSTEFQRIVRDLSVIGDTCTISCGKQGVTFGVSGDTGSGKMTRRQNTSADKPDEQTTIYMEEPVELTFALRYLNFFTKATPLSSTVTLLMNKDVPLVVEYKIESLGHVRYYLAPKIDDDAA